MKNRILLLVTLAISLFLPIGFVWAGGVTTSEKLSLTATAPDAVNKNADALDQEQIYGVQLMTPQERAAFRAKMLAVKTSEQREQIRKENHKNMQKRAESHGLTLPDQAPARKRDMGQGKVMMNQDGSLMNQSDGTSRSGGMGGGMSGKNSQ